MTRRTTIHRSAHIDHVADRKWKECDHVLAIRARRYEADEIPYHA